MSSSESVSAPLVVDLVDYNSLCDLLHGLGYVSAANVREFDVVRDDADVVLKEKADVGSSENPPEAESVEVVTVDKTHMKRVIDATRMDSAQLSKTSAKITTQLVHQAESAQRAADGEEGTSSAISSPLLKLSLSADNIRTKFLSAGDADALSVEVATRPAAERRALLQAVKKFACEALKETLSPIKVNDTTHVKGVGTVSAGRLTKWKTNFAPFLRLLPSAAGSSCSASSVAAEDILRQQVVGISDVLARLIDRDVLPTAYTSPLPALIVLNDIAALLQWIAAEIAASGELDTKPTHDADVSPLESVAAKLLESCCSAYADELKSIALTKRSGLYGTRLSAFVKQWNANVQGPNPTQSTSLLLRHVVDASLADDAEKLMQLVSSADEDELSNDDAVGFKDNLKKIVAAIEKEFASLFSQTGVEVSSLMPNLSTVRNMLAMCR